MMTLMVIISLIGVFTPETAGVWEPDEKMNTANVAWMITATIFVLMMTPGLSFFYGGMVVFGFYELLYSCFLNRRKKKSIILPFFFLY